MKLFVLIADGMSDHPLRELAGRTPLQAAFTPHLDWLAQQGTVGWVNNVPKGLPPGSDVAIMSILGYDPRRYYSGRGPLEAASLGIPLAGGDVAFRCNLVSIKKGKMESFTAHHIATKTAHRLINLLNKHLASPQVRFYAGLSYRNLLVIKGKQAQSLKRLRCVPPHDITGRSITPYLPKSSFLLQLMKQSRKVLQGSLASLIWPWSPGESPSLPTFQEKYRCRGAMITAVDLLKGLAKVVGLKVVKVPGATGYLDSNFRGKAEYALRAAQGRRVVFLHVEAPDEAGHEGNLRKKIKAIEEFDRQVVGTILQHLRQDEGRLRLLGQPCQLLVLPDHPTPLQKKTHTAEAVPFVLYPATPWAKGKFTSYDERQARHIWLKEGWRLLAKLLR